MRLTETDASFIYNESASGPMHISSVYILEGEASFDAIFERFEKRIHLIPAYRRKLALVPFSLGHPKWVDDPDFDLANHVLLRKLPFGTSLEDGMDKAVELNEPMLDRRRPLWKTIIIQGVTGKTLILQMAHHSIIDGASGVDLTNLIYDLDLAAEDPVPPNETWQPEPAPAPMELVNEALQENLENFANTNPAAMLNIGTRNWHMIRKAAAVMTRFISRPAITAPFNAGRVGPKRNVKWMKKPFAEIREIRRSLGGTINDVVLVVVSEAIARYLKQHGERVTKQYLRIMCPVNVRTEDQKGALGNQVSAIFPMLPAWPMDSVDRLGLVVEEIERIKDEEEAQALTVAQQSMPVIPPIGMAATQLIGTPLDPTAMAAFMPPPIAPDFGFRPPNMGINLVCTNVPGVQVPQYLCGHELTDTVGLLVLTGNIGLSVTILSYNKQLFFSFICEPRLLPDLEKIEGFAEEVFNELLSAARDKEQNNEEN